MSVGCRRVPRLKCVKTSLGSRWSGYSQSANRTIVSTQVEEKTKSCGTSSSHVSLSTKNIGDGGGADGMVNNIH